MAGLLSRLPWWCVEPLALTYDLLRALLRICLDEALGRAGLVPAQFPLITKAAIARGNDESCRLLTALTGRQVAAVRSAPPDGIVGDAAVGTERLWLRVKWANEMMGDDAAESCLFVKLPSERLWLRSFLTLTGLYANEARFYAAIAPQLPPCLLPRVHAAMCQRSRFALVLEDLKAAGADAAKGAEGAAEGGYRLYNLTEELSVPQLEPVLLALAKLHAAFWGRPHAVWRESSRPPFYKLLMLAVLRQIKAHQPSVLPAHAEALFLRFVRRYDAVRAAWSEPPLCLVHGDAHLGNVFTATAQQASRGARGVGSGGCGGGEEGGGTEDGPGGVCAGLFDWQVVSAEQPMRDVAYFLQLSAGPELLAAHERSLIRFYLAALRAELASAPQPPPGAPARPAVPTEAEAWEGYRLHSLYSLLAFVLTSGAADFVRDANVVAQLSRRCVGACERLDTRGALEAAIAKFDAAADRGLG